MKFYNVGLKNISSNSQAESYRTVTGPQAERIFDEEDSRSHVQGHFFGSGEKDGERTTIGASGRSRIWSNQYLSVTEFRKWVAKIDFALTGNVALSQTGLDVIRTPTRLERFPAQILAALWPKEAFRDAPLVRHSEHVGEDNVLLIELDFCNFEVNAAGSELHFVLACERYELPMTLSMTNGGTFSFRSVAKLEVEMRPGEWLELDEWLNDSGVVFYGVDGSSFEGLNQFPAPLTASKTVNPDLLIDLDWDGCTIDIEYLPPIERVAKERTRQAVLKRRTDMGSNVTVQEWLQAWLKKQDGVVSIFYDHRSSEAADFIVFSRIEDKTQIAFYHCKSATSPSGEGTVGDLYEVAGQFVKSVVYCDAATLAKHIKRRVNPKRSTYPSVFISGDLDTTLALLAEANSFNTTFAVFGVQPGIKKSSVDEGLADLMNFGMSYVRHGGVATARWIVRR